MDPLRKSQSNLILLALPTNITLGLKLHAVLAQKESTACRYAECSGAAKCSTAFSKLTLSIMNDSQRNTKKRETQHNHK